MKREGWVVVRVIEGVGVISEKMKDERGTKKISNVSPKKT